MKKLLLAIMLCFTTATVQAQAKDLVLSADNTLIMNDEFTGQSVTELMEKASKMNSSLPSGYPINVFIYSPGGEIQAGLELIEFLNSLNRPVNTVTLFAASMGFQLVQHMEGKRYIVKYGVLMSHKARGGFSGEFGGGISQLDSRYGLWLRRIQMMDEQTVKRTNGKQTLKSYTDAYSQELWLNGEEAVKQGYADEVVTVKCDKSLDGSFSRTYDFMIVQFDVEFSNCPMKTYPLSIQVKMHTNQGLMKVEDFLAQGGKFGPECGTALYNEDLCASNKSLTLEKIQEEVKKQKSILNRDLKDRVIYSY